WYNTGLVAPDNNGVARRPFSTIFSFGDQLKCLDNSLDWMISGRALDGLYYAKLGITKALKSNFSFNLNYKAMIRPRTADLDYLLYPGEWTENKWNNTLNAELKKDYKGFNSSGNYSLKLRTSGPGRSYSYSS